MPKHNSRGTHSSSVVGTAENKPRDNKILRKGKNIDPRTSYLRSGSTGQFIAFKAVHLLNCSKILGNLKFKKEKMLVLHLLSQTIKQRIQILKTKISHWT